MSPNKFNAMLMGLVLQYDTRYIYAILMFIKKERENTFNLFVISVRN